MSRRDGKMWLALRLVTRMDTNIGIPVQADDDGRAGMMPVFWTKAAAREAYGRDVLLIEVGKVE
jgi:hypothetical protein